SSPRSVSWIVFKHALDETADRFRHVRARRPEKRGDAVAVEYAVGDEYGAAFVAARLRLAAVHGRVMIAATCAPRERALGSLLVVAELKPERHVVVIEPDDEVELDRVEPAAAGLPR